MEKTETAPSKSAFKDPAKSCVGFSDQVFAGRRDGRRYLVQTLKLRLRGSNRGGIGGEEQYPAVHTGETTSTIAEGVERDESTRPSTNQEHTYLRSCRVVPKAEMDVWVTRAYSAPLRGGGQTEFGHGDPSPIRPQLTVRSSSALHIDPVIFTIMSCATPRQWTSTRATPNVSLRSRHPPFSSEFPERRRDVSQCSLLTGSVKVVAWSFPPFTAASVSTYKRTSSLKLSAVQDCNQPDFAETLAPDISSSLDA